ncbi:FtsX-like permease family protein [Streptomyces xanthophaeus]|uniref:FtsX-like permease family protein n=1 Tax=Streptomyces xanthophaeus TaxID=67385 RepID=UPI0004CDD286|nr:ABC transporter permease [Streptomyces xanthophaeus]
MSLRPNGLARAAVRLRPAAFAGTFVALLMTVAIVSACGILLESGLRAGVPPTRYSAVPVVIAADQQIHLRSGSGEGSYEVSARVPERARVDAALLEQLAPLGRAVPDVVFPVRDAAGNTSEASGWGSTAFTGTQLSTGRAPGAGEVVLGGPARGEARVTLDTPVGPREFRVTGHTETPGTWFSDPEARTLSGHPTTLDAIALLPQTAPTPAPGPAPGTASASLAAPAPAVAPSTASDAVPGTAVAPGTASAAAPAGTAPSAGTAAAAGPAGSVSPERLAASAEAVVAGRAEVLTGDERALDPQLHGAKELLTALGGSFGGTATLVAVFTAAGTVALSVGQRSREFALLRAVGATPRQIRRTIATEALLVAPVAGALGCLPGYALASWWFGQLKAKGAVPAAVELSVSWIPLLSAVGIGLATALLAGWAAARRPARIRPGQALAAAAVERVRPGWVRTPLGLAALAGGAACAALAATGSGADAADASLGVVMLFMLAVALLGPLIARACATVLGLPMRLGGGPSGALAAANSRAHARRLASAITPIVLAMAFSSTLVFLHTSEDRAARLQQESGLLADRIVTAPPSDAATRPLPAGATAAVAVTRTSVVAVLGSGSDRWLQSASAQAVTGSGADLAQVQDLGVREGSLAALRPGTVAVDRTLADSAKAGLGDRLHLHLPDGTAAAPEIVAVYTRGLGLGELTLPAADLAGRTTSGTPTELLVRGDPPALAALAGLGPVTDRQGWTTAQDAGRELNAWANTTMAAVLGGFAAVAAANTLVMTVLDRRRELQMLRLIGSTRRQVLRMLRWEALLITGAGLALGSAIALATLFPLTRALTGEAPYVPPVLYGSFVAAGLLLGLAATGLPARRALHPARS